MLPRHPSWRHEQLIFIFMGGLFPPSSRSEKRKEEANVNTDMPCIQFPWRQKPSWPPHVIPKLAQSSDALRHSRPMPPPSVITRTIHRIACAPPSRNPTKDHDQFYASPNAPPLNTSQNNAPSAPLHSHPRRRRRRLLAARPAPLPRPASPSPPHGSRRPRPRPPSVVRRARPAVRRRRRRGRPLGRHGSRPQHQPIRRVFSLPTSP